MTSPTNALSFNLYVQQIGILAVALTQESGGVFSFVDAPLQGTLPSMLNYAELRCARDLDLLSSQSSNVYTLTVGQNVFSLPVNDFVTVQTLEILQMSGSTVVNAIPLIPTSKELIQNCYSGVFSSGCPKYYALYGSNFGDNDNTETNILLGPPSNFAYPLRVTGTVREASLYQNAAAGIADTAYTYLSQWYPDLLVMASMIYVSGFQRNFSASSDSKDMPVNYEQQYRTLLAGAIAEENRKKGMGSGWSAYSTPVTATPTR